MLNGISQQAIGGNVPNRLYNGLPIGSTTQLPISRLGAPILPGIHNGEVNPNIDLTYSPGLVETSGVLSQVQTFNPPAGQKVANKMTVWTNAAGNSILNLLIG